VRPTVDIDYVEGNGGPGILDLGDAPAPAVGEELDAATQAPIYPGWDEKTIEQFVRGTGAGIHMLAGRAEKDWVMTEKDLERIVPPLTRICNRYEPTLRLSPIADPLLVAHGFALYGWRSALEAKRAQRDAEEEAQAGPGYERGPAPDEDLEVDVELEHDRYFDEGDSHA
jgi:hypothetical protein